MKRLAMLALWHLCGIIDRLPGPVRNDDGWTWQRHAQLGCYPLGLATKALDLEARWGIEA